MEHWNLLQQLTIASKDNGICFTEYNRLAQIIRLAGKSEYKVVHQGDLSIVLAHPDFQPAEKAVLLSSHIDSVYNTCFARQESPCWLGTWDNSATNALTVGLMLEGALSPQVLIAFTGDEEKNSEGAREVMKWCGEELLSIARVIVTDVSNEGWDDEVAFSIENDWGFDILSGYEVIRTIQDTEYPCVFVHQGEPDETWKYREGIEGVFPPVPCLSVCLPVKGDMHHDNGTWLRPENLSPYCQVLTALANLPV